MMRTTRTMLLAAGIGTLLLGGCAQEGEVAGVPTTSSTTSESAPAPTSAAEGTSDDADDTSDDDAESTSDDDAESTSDDDADDESDDDGTAAAPPPSSGAQAEGSGCTPGDDDDLPDGRWFGKVTGADDDSLDFNLKCRYTGAEAVKASIEDGKGDMVPNDHYERDEQDTERELEYAADAPAFHTTGEPQDVEQITMQEWVGLADEVPFDVWLTVEDGTVVKLEEQWVP